MIVIFESYYEPDELIPLIENRDYNNISLRSIFNYYAINELCLNNRMYVNYNNAQHKNNYNKNCNGNKT